MKPEEGSRAFPAGGLAGERERWLKDRIVRFLAASVELLVDVLGRRNVRSIFLIGSFASEEGSVVLETESPLVLSDFDIAAVLVSHEVFEHFYPLRRELGLRCKGLLDEVSFLSHVDVGFYVPESLRMLPARPGAFDFKHGGRCIFGEPEDRGFIPDYQPSHIGGREAVALIENRIIGHLAATAAPPPLTERERYRFFYDICRVYTDLLTAALAMRGYYRMGYGARCALLRDAGVVGGIRDLVSERALAGFEAWTRFKLEPSIRSLPRHLCDAGVENLWEDAASDLIGSWKRLEMSQQGMGTDSAARRTAESLIGTRRDATSGLQHLRCWRGYLRTLPLGRKISIAVSMGGGLIRRDPFALIREHGVMLLDRYIRGLRDSAVPSARGGFPHRGGNWSEAASEVVSHWERFVFG